MGLLQTLVLKRRLLSLTNVKLRLNTAVHLDLKHQNESVVIMNFNN